MSGVFFDQLGIRPPDVHLQIGSASHGVQTGKIMVAFDEWLEARSQPPRAVVVVGDVNSTMACALVAVKRGIDVVHVESGLRSFDREMPEEINRTVTDAVSNLLLVSEPAGLENLQREGISSSRVRYVGNVMIDTLVHQLPAAREMATSTRWGLARGEYAVVTLHRPANVDVAGRLESLHGFLRGLAARMPVVFPIHPRTSHRLQQLHLRDSLASTPGLHVSEPLGYREFLSLVDGARLVVTDSGGIQEETTYLGIPCITLRTSTERPITISQGTNVLVGDDLSAASSAFTEILAGRAKMGQAIDGWDGRASERVVDALLALK
jgi:UDP-N-acetylglucosamine 2-epimerase (non-hydrolysing)